MKKAVEIKGMAKVNLGLDVLRRRENGYHDVKMVMQSVNLYDVLKFEIAKEAGIKICCNTGELPLDDGNLIYKAARLFFEQTGIDGAVSIYLEKNIPIAAGMAGGSTDAAATLLALNTLYETGLSKEELANIGVKIGADVPYCIYGGTYLSEGIGEVLSPIENDINCYIVIAKPEFGVSTKYVYDNLHVETIDKHPDIDGMIEFIRTGDLKGMASKMENILETVTVKEYPQIEEMKQCLIENGALNALMSGSGPTVFGIFEKKEIAEKAYGELKMTGLVKQGCVTTFANETGIIE